MNRESQIGNWLVYMTDGNGGTQPAPYVLTDQELIAFLRLDTMALKKPLNTLKYYRGEGLLRSTRLSKGHVTTLPEAVRFLGTLTEQKKN
jgi:hypothetical protein